MLRTAHPEVDQLFAYGPILFRVLDITRTWTGQRHISGELVDLNTGQSGIAIWAVDGRHPIPEAVESILFHEFGPLTEGGES